MVHRLGTWVMMDWVWARVLVDRLRSPTRSWHLICGRFLQTVGQVI